MVNKELVDSIKAQENQGYSEIQLVNYLAQQGYI